MHITFWPSAKNVTENALSAVVGLRPTQVIRAQCTQSLAITRGLCRRKKLKGFASESQRSPYCRRSKESDMTLYELHQVNQLIPKMIAQKISLDRGFIAESRFIFHVGGCYLTAGQILDLEQKNGLTGIWELSKISKTS